MYHAAWLTRELTMVLVITITLKIQKGVGVGGICNSNTEVSLFNSSKLAFLWFNSSDICIIAMLNVATKSQVLYLLLLSLSLYILSMNAPPPKINSSHAET
jgi:hypothetical protein